MKQIAMDCSQVTLFRVNLFLVFWLFCAVLPSRGTIQLSPTELTVNEGQHAEFNCTFTCRDSHDATMIWLVGHTQRRSFIMETAASFTDRTGLHVEVERLFNCNRHGIALERLRINASSAEQYNRTAVQCWVPPLGDDPRLYSQYSLMFINLPERPTLSPSPTVAPSSSLQNEEACPTVTSLVATPTPPVPCPSPVTHTEVVTVTEEVVINILPTSSPLADVINNLEDYCSLLSSSLRHSASAFTCVLGFALAVVLCCR